MGWGFFVFVSGHNGTQVATLQGAFHRRVSAGTDWPGVSIPLIG